MSSKQIFAHRVDKLRKLRRYREMTSLLNRRDFFYKILDNDTAVQTVSSSVWKAVFVDDKWWYFNSETWETELVY